MTASRSYNHPISSAAARQELQRCAGTQFDPELVATFLAIPTRRTGWLAGLAAVLIQIRVASHVVAIP